MKVIRGFKLALPVAAVAVLALMSAPSALASGYLVLKTEGVVAPKGSKAEVRFVTAQGCKAELTGEVWINHFSPDVLKTPSSENVSCDLNPEEKISSQIKEVFLLSSGTETLAGSITISPSPSCSYVFTNPHATFEVPGFVTPEGHMTGKLVEGSNKSCAPEKTEQFWAFAFGEYGRIFEDSLS